MHALDPGGAGLAWRAIADSLPRPSAVLLASAHWEAALPTLGSGIRHDTIHDFGGFPRGSPEVAQQAATLLRAAGLAPSMNDSRGLDHGAWVPLKWMYPHCDVPVVQVSVQTALGTAHHLCLGEALAPLAAEGVLIIGSGHATHNLRDWFAHHADPHPLDYVVQFSQWLQERLAADDRDSLLSYRDRAPSAARAHPTEEHFLPLFVALGAAGKDAKASRVYSAIDGAALSMDAYLFER
jgi:4,5-DOPA dioxygenase extradiol